ncbi:hypothetical protein GYA49_03505 [Candidatus Beckwithbacteria bacterium]|nr:hypothetical protein [Candidatus Beckwithbacteria bacterium]
MFGKKLSPKLLLFLPIATYLVSYIYLAFYHHKFWLWNVVVHEGGEYTLLQTTLYASHFLGHIPVHTLLAFLLLGLYLILTKPKTISSNHISSFILIVLLLAFLATSVLISNNLFGWHDTWLYIAQGKQSLATYGEGGSWNLHIPSTMLLFFLLPMYVLLIKYLFSRKIEFSKQGLSLIAIAFGLFVAMTLLVNTNPISAIISIWQTPRYLAHSIRELATFPLTYFPIPLYFYIRNEAKAKNQVKLNKVTLIIILLFFIGFLGILYQAVISLHSDVGSIAQKPDFAKNGELSIIYLLASHYFEHFLDTIYFTLLSLLLYIQAIKLFHYEK